MIHLHCEMMCSAHPILTSYHLVHMSPKTAPCGFFAQKMTSRLRTVVICYQQSGLLKAFPRINGLKVALKCLRSRRLLQLKALIKWLPQKCECSECSELRELKPLSLLYAGRQGVIVDKAAFASLCMDGRCFGKARKTSLLRAHMQPDRAVTGTVRPSGIDV